MEHTRVQKALLATLRATLRHIRQHFDVRAAAPAQPASAAAAAAPQPPRDVSHFTSFVLAEYRRGAAVKDRARVRQLRAHATDMLGYFEATVQQNVSCLGWRWAARDALRGRPLSRPHKPPPPHPPPRAAAAAAAPDPAGAAARL
jgi:hypothetical protein